MVIGDLHRLGPDAILPGTEKNLPPHAIGSRPDHILMTTRLRRGCGLDIAQEGKHTNNPYCDTLSHDYTPCSTDHCVQTTPASLPLVMILRIFFIAFHPLKGKTNFLECSGRFQPRYCRSHLHCIQYSRTIQRIVSRLFTIIPAHVCPPRTIRQR